jgi:hypothetical protein
MQQNNQVQFISVPCLVTDALIDALTGHDINYLRETDLRSAKVIEDRAQLMWNQLLSAACRIQRDRELARQQYLGLIEHGKGE